MIVTVGTGLSDNSRSNCTKGNKVMFKMKDIDDMFSLIDTMLAAPVTSRAGYTANGLKTLFPRPHNLYVERNKKNNDILKYIIETVYTPWSKNDISVKFKNDRDGTRLIICVGKEEDESKAKTEETDIETVCQYHGISSKSYSIEFPLPDNINAKAIAVSAVDGLLRIELPVDHSSDTELDFEIK